MKSEISFRSNVSKTLLIPLYIRAIESRKKNPLLKDVLAEKMIERIDYDFHSLDKYLPTGQCCVIRAKYNDLSILRSVERFSSNIVVNVGCGLDSRYARIPSSNIVFYELDLPDVIDLRKKLIPEENTNRYITKSMFDTSWLDELLLRHGDSHFLFVFEGVLMYFDKTQVSTLLNNIAERFHGAEIFFDMCNKESLKINFGLLRDFGSHFKMGVNSGHEIELMVRKLRLEEQRKYLNHVPISIQYMDNWSLMRFKVTNCL
jgi:methyltransferase (TIGR00027 family)